MLKDKGIKTLAKNSPGHNPNKATPTDIRSRDRFWNWLTKKDPIKNKEV